MSNVYRLGDGGQQRTAAFAVKGKQSRAERSLLTASSPQRQQYLRATREGTLVEALSPSSWTRVFRVFRVRELAGRSGSASETPPLNPPRRSKEVGVARHHPPRKQQGKRYSPANAAANCDSTLGPLSPRPPRSSPYG